MVNSQKGNLTQVKQTVTSIYELYFTIAKWISLSTVKEVHIVDISQQKVIKKQKQNTIYTIGNTKSQWGMENNTAGLALALYWSKTRVITIYSVEVRY